GRLHEVAARAAPVTGSSPTAREDGCALRPLEEAEDALLLRLRDDRAHLDLVRLYRVADLQRLDLRHELLEEGVVDLRARDHAGAGGAVLARVPERRKPDALGDGL